VNGEIRSKVDVLWNAFWTGGISNALEVIEQITCLLFLKRLDDLHALEENKAARLKLKKLERRVFPEGKDPKGRAYEDCRWSRFKHFEAKEMFEVVDQHVFPFLRTLGGDGSTYAHHMKDARFPGHALPSVLHSWKSFTAKAANRLLGRTGDFWQTEYYDHLIRDEADYAHALHYLLENPVVAGLSDWPWVWSREVAS
jgi:hypothetical protein